MEERRLDQNIDNLLSIPTSQSTLDQGDDLSLIPEESQQQNLILNDSKITLLHTHEIKLGDTVWPYLAAIRDNQSILPYLQEKLFTLQIPEDQLTYFITLSSFCAYIEKGSYFSPEIHGFYTYNLHS